MNNLIKKEIKKVKVLQVTILVVHNQTYNPSEKHSLFTNQ